MKVCICCFKCILLIYLCAITAYGSSERWADNKNGDGVGERGASLLSTTDADDFGGRLNKAHHRGGLRSVYSVGKGEESFISVRGAATIEDESDDDDEEEEEDGASDDTDYPAAEDEKTVILSVHDQNGELTHNANDTEVKQMAVLKDITDKVKREVTEVNMDRVNQVDAPSIAEEERKINEFYEYENEVLKNIREKKKIFTQ
ncbi:hypothetical protein PCYB_111260 [Plasmodium cynomolgi strain B]|uniref:Uncharacterized protein n=1 Tax=Plasmodium cynomolgi (strain B) TaxID=1120755 RepID=K6UXC3_PLACD|nr:hypothetical protein PCYB_111260 [Plasmodium cynomolgi strain B]GAB67105.1 hypothetical protein PCYB_111260 [Plasmodium cynomolgi strain B]